MNVIDVRLCQAVWRRLDWDVFGGADGPAILLSTDLLAQTAPINFDLLIGMMAGIVGGICLLYLVSRRQR